VEIMRLKTEVEELKREQKKKQQIGQSLFVVSFPSILPLLLLYYVPCDINASISVCESLFHARSLSTLMRISETCGSLLHLHWVSFDTDAQVSVCSSFQPPY
jgi:hypothetical protein